MLGRVVVVVVNYGFTLVLSACQSHSPGPSTQADLQPCRGKVAVRGTVVSPDGGRSVPYPGATVSIIQEWGIEAAAVVTSDSRGRFAACVPPGKFAVTATAPDRMPSYQPPRIMAAASERQLTLRAGGVELAGVVAQARLIPAHTYVRATRVSSDIGDIFYAPVQHGGRFSLRLFSGFDYQVDVVGELVSLPTRVRMESDVRVRLPALSRRHVESPPDGAVMRWLRAAAMPLQPYRPVEQTDDWRAFQSIIGDATVVGLGENTHGAGSFAEMRNRLLHAAVTRLGFNVFAIEANFTEALAINDYVLTGRGDPKKALAGLHFWVSDNEQTNALIAWIRQYNADPEHARKIKFYGVDMQFSHVTYRELVKYLARVDQSAASEAETRLAALGSEDGSRFTALSRHEQRSVCESAVAQVGSLDANRARYIDEAGKEAWRMARQNAVVLSQACGLSIDLVNAYGYRDQAMAQNVRWIVDTEGPDTRVLLWAHNGHIATADVSSRPMGAHLRAALGRDYVAVGQFFDRGSFRAWDLKEKEADKRSVAPISVPSAPRGYLEAALAKVGTPVWALDLRRAPREGAVWKWLSTPHPIREIGSLYLNEANSRMLRAIVDDFDALIFIEEVTPTRPNPTGLRGPASR